MVGRISVQLYKRIVERRKVGKFLLWKVVLLELYLEKFYVCACAQNINEKELGKRRYIVHREGNERERERQNGKRNVGK